MRGLVRWLWRLARGVAMPVKYIAALERHLGGRAATELISSSPPGRTAARSFQEVRSWQRHRRRQTFRGSPVRGSELTTGSTTTRRRSAWTRSRRSGPHGAATPDKTWDIKVLIMLRGGPQFDTSLSERGYAASLEALAK